MRNEHLSSILKIFEERFSIFDDRYLIIDDDDEMKKGKSEIRCRKSRDNAKSEMAISHACKNLNIADVVSVLCLHKRELSE